MRRTRPRDRRVSARFQSKKNSKVVQDAYARCLSGLSYLARHPAIHFFPVEAPPKMVGNFLLPISCQYTSYSNNCGPLPLRSTSFRLSWDSGGLFFFLVLLRWVRPCSPIPVGYAPIWAPPSSTSSATVRGFLLNSPLKTETDLSVLFCSCPQCDPQCRRQ